VPDLRAVLVAVGVGGGVAAYTLLWWHWPIALVIGAAILIGGLALTGTISVRPDGRAADEAWRAAAPDLQPTPDEPPDGIEARRPPGPRATSRDLPSGD
jgi:hypothetical protein